MWTITLKANDERKCQESWLSSSVKVSILASGPDTEFKAAGTAHPGYASRYDASYRQLQPFNYLSEETMVG